MPASPLVSHAVAARARAGLIGDPDLIRSTTVALNEAKALSAIRRAGLDRSQRDRVATALLTGTVDAWLDRRPGAAPDDLTPEVRAEVVRLLGGAR